MARFASLLALAPLMLMAACSSAPNPEVDPPVQMHAEAGYLEVPGQVAGATDHARMFYSFHPAETHPERAPLLVFFNGGPGAATSSILLPFGTGPKTLHADDLGAGVTDNPASFTRFANLLYLDERDAGFSYELGATCNGNASYITDAGDFASALLSFLDAHTSIAASPVVVVGESYGGTRAPVMIALLQRYADPAAVNAMLRPPGGPGGDVEHDLPWLRDRMQAHLDLAFPDRAGKPWAPEAVAGQFGWEVLIQPNFAGTLQFDLQDAAEANDPLISEALARQPPVDRYDVRLTADDQQALMDGTDHLVRDPDTLQALLGVSLESIEGLAAAQRGEGVVRDADPQDLPVIAEDESKLRMRLGQLGPSDAYYLGQVTPRCGGYLGDIGSAQMMFEGLSRTRAFITNARYDSVVYTPVIPTIFSRAQASVTVDDRSPAGAARPGVIHIAVQGAASIDIRFPSYEAGHEVTMSAGAELGEDVEAWLREAGAIRP